MRVFGLLSDSVRGISALEEDFDYVIKDDILGFNSLIGTMLSAEN
jgi:hypothetical protein